jgi:hypothetical protein
MAQTITDQKLESLRRCVTRLETRCPETAEALYLEGVVAMLLEDGEPKLEAQFVGTQQVALH